ncbi:hypothetical protein M231_03396 [Tremella mesenterica]|uniref:AAA protein C-terminal winged helix domain-containing protein n=1 Tax=Tremella mesenterica TaxID=5217 RepID=A0A4V1M468_TREME|nr:hypothetical protein M231_03396 [Tremella mesenterica]
MLFSTDDFWCLDMMKKNASRMRIVSVYDLPAAESIRALQRLRRASLIQIQSGLESEEVKVESDDILRQVYELVGGRTSYLARVARAPDMLDEAKYMVEMEKEWLLSRIGLIPDHDDDVMDEQKWASCSWLLLRHLAQKVPPVTEDITMTTLDEDLEMAKVSYAEARVISTRTDFLQPLDQAHIISIDVHHHVRPDSVLLLRAVQSVISEPGFDEDLDKTRARIDEIEGLHRQSELTVKEPFRVVVGKKEGKTVLDVIGLGGSFVSTNEDSENTEDPEDPKEELVRVV